MIAIETVIEGCRKGDPKMQKELYDQYSPRLYALCRRYAPDDYTASEILVEGFLEVFDSIGSYGGTGSLLAWMKTVFVRKAVAIYRRNKPHLMEPCDERVEAMPAATNRVDHQLDIRQAVAMAMKSLDDRDRIIFNLIAVEEYSMAAAARELNVPESTVKTRYYHVRDRVRKQLVRSLGNDYLLEK